jgi:periplasmic protein TonB
MRRSDLLKRGAGVLISVGVHVAIMLVAPRNSAARAAAFGISEVAFEPVPAAAEPLPAPPVDEAQRPATSGPAPAVPRAAARAAAAPKAAAAAVAGAALTAPDSANDAVADFTLVTGTGTEYAGGTTTAMGTSTSAVRGPVSASPVVGAAAAVAPAAIGPDRSRTAIPLATDWNCSRLFPADEQAGNQASVLIAVTVGSGGEPRSVVVLRDPGHGFAQAARTCALGERYRPALDRTGNPIVAATPPITVRFTR